MRQDRRTSELLDRWGQDQGIADKLGPGRVAVLVGSDVAREPQGQLLTFFSINLLARLHPVVRQLGVLVPDIALRGQIPRFRGRSIRDVCHQLLGDLGSPVERRILRDRRATNYDVVACIGNAARGSPVDLFVGSVGWQCSLSVSSPVESGGRANPVGAFATACFLAGEVWKRLTVAYKEELFPHIPIVPLEDNLTFSTFDYGLGNTGENPDLPNVLDIDSLCLVGLGAGGAASAFTLAAVENVTGRLVMIDPDEITDGNLSSFVCGVAVDVCESRSKVLVVEEVLTHHPGLHTCPIGEPFDVAMSRSDPKRDLRHVAAAVHSREARRSIQLETPYVAWDAGATETGEFHVWRSEFGVSQCLYCRFADRDVNPEKEKAEQLRQLFDLGHVDWNRKLRNNEAFSPKEAVAMADQIRAKGLDLRPPQARERFGDWEKATCGKLNLPDADNEVPIPFAPVMAGVLMAGEIIKQYAFPHAVLRSQYWNTLVGRFLQRQQPRLRPPSPKCPICQDETIQSQHTRRWV